MKRNIEREERLWVALKRISSYHDPQWFEKNAGPKYGLDPREALEMAYENVLSEARDAIKGLRRPTALSAAKPSRGDAHVE